MTLRSQGRAARGERGVALVLAMMALLVLSALGAGLVLTTSTEAVISANFRIAVEARFALRAVAERSIADLALLASWNPALNGVQRSSFTEGAPGGSRALPGGVAIDLTHIVNTANCGQPAGCTQAAMDAVTPERPWGPNNPRWQLYGWGPIALMAGSADTGRGFYGVALVADDGAENDGNPGVDGDGTGNPGSGRLMLRAFVFGPRGARSGLELTLARRDDGGLKVLSIKDL
jgi:hypothetical protein